MFSSALNQLANQFGSDKGSEHGDRHRYAQIYDLLFHNQRLTTGTIVELGLAQGPHDPVLGLGAQRPTVGGTSPSVAMWLNYFPQARVFGFDIADFSHLTTGNPRFTFIQGDAGSVGDLQRLAGSVGGEVDILIDDASHASFHQQLALRELLPRVRSGGIYIIEDLHVQPQGIEQALPPTPRTIDWLEAFRSGTGHLSAVWNASAIRALHLQCASLVIIRASEVPGSRFQNALAIIRKH